MTEFDLISRYFSRPSFDKTVVIGVGDDAAVVNPPAQELLVFTTDTLIEGRHFLPTISAQTLAKRVIAVNVSDLAAMGAQPRYALLSLTLPQLDEQWLAQFSESFYTAAHRYHLDLIGGNTTRGATMSIGLTAVGSAPGDLIFKRSGAQAGDDIWVSGSLGGAALGLLLCQSSQEPAWQHLSVAQRCDLISRYETPAPRVALGLGLRGLASSCIDLSDGLAGDVAHVAKASKLCFVIDVDRLPLHEALTTRGHREQNQSSQSLFALHLAVSGGDDYELCFTAAVAQRAAIERLSQALDVPLTRIGEVRPASQGDTSIIWMRDGTVFPMAMSGFDHFVSV